ncbi:MAG TPA: O-antigen ligase family protein [Terriglobales bacterium]|nr:O-antigen ligase family protein [Terriglobales bacterium]
MSYAVPLTEGRLRQPLLELAVLPLKLLHLFLNQPALIFLLALAGMLFRPPDLKWFPVDRLGFLAVILWLCSCLAVGGQRLRRFPATWPLLGLLLLGLWGAVTQPYDSQAWSVFAAKWAVPVLFFQVSGMIFSDENSLRKLEIFLLTVLVYLSAISVFSLFNLHGLVWPAFISDESIGIHADRARGPFLQAVANGVCLNLLGLLALDSFRRGKLNRAVAGILLLIVPLALLATKTRAVWASAAFSVIFLLLFGSARNLRKAALALCFLAIAGGGIFLAFHDDVNDFGERLMDRSPVDFRSEMYQAGWQIFLERPLLGWGNEWKVQPEVESRVSSFHPEYYVFHNTFLELGVDHGLLGLGLYLWLIICLFQLGKSKSNFGHPDGAFIGPHFRKLWPLLLAVYLLNASAVVMNYQFVNAVVFTIAGILASQSEIDRKPLRPYLVVAA